MKTNIIKYIAAASVVMGLASCDDLFEPAIENIKDENSMETEPNYADAILGSAYILMPYPSVPENDVATDDAVSNDINNEYLSLAGGSWTSQTGVSVNNWRDRNASIQYCNLLLEHVDAIQFSSTESINEMFRDRLRGEAYGLRALNMLYLLQNYAGKTASGELAGVPIWTSSFGASSDLNVPRNSFSECMEQLLSDVDKAIANLPVDYKDISDSEVPSKYASKGVSAAMYNRVNGATTALRLSGRIAEAIAAQATLLAASPAFSDQSGVSWEDAANRAGSVLDRIGGVNGLAAKGHVWFSAAEIGNSVTASENHPEVIWRGGAEENSTIEGDNFPPSLYGKGRVNPTQNLVDAFPMANGYPISDSRSEYDKANPYAGRDPRLAAYIVTDGSTLGVNNATISTGENSSNNDGINKESGYSTRTGYYLRKLLRNDVDPNSTNEIKKYHYTTRIRFTEIFLAYAEAANEAWGPTATGSHGYSAYDVIKAIRQRAGVGVDNGDPYLESAKASKESMRELIRNERRIELCFENKRFWDLRRWKSDLNETAKGVSINGISYNYIDVEPRHYSDYMIYGPLPYTDVLKFSNLEQNAGW
ncbi:MAG: RagB/SusD family nutrient uptake outer membrane protein [Muribaculaceae bacterium]|nr:RagB/SusD family nutrient uptake outer membrane protein [Muribaculaceae bacterium]MDE5712473.1 RagB/SusD family nutrient uptake outer membrane protein [Muribaculaceae bacterium]